MPVLCKGDRRHSHSHVQMTFFKMAGFRNKKAKFKCPTCNGEKLVWRSFGGRIDSEWTKAPRRGFAENTKWEDIIVLCDQNHPPARMMIWKKCGIKQSEVKFRCPACNGAKLVWRSFFKESILVGGELRFQLRSKK